VPWELKERMKTARAYVNWSSVACDAFEQKLAELGPIEEINSVEGALARMKFLQKEGSGTSDSGCQSGKESGIHWALNLAGPSQLQRIEDFRDQIPDDQWEAYMYSRDGWVELGKCIEPRRDHRRGPGQKSIEAEPFPDEQWEDLDRTPGRHRRSRRGKGPGREMDIWRSILDRRPEHPGFFLGFAEGALEIWKQIKDQL
jgi:hypothetical protein